MVDKFCKAVSRVIYIICCILLACQVIIVSGVAASRYILKYTPPWGENLALICMVWFCLLSSAVAISGDLHLKVTLIDSFISEKTRIIMDLLDLVLVFVFGLVMVFGSYGLLELTSRNIMTGLGVPSSVLYAVIPVTGVAFLVSTIDRARALIGQLKEIQKHH